jgi:SAM-dependent methyltransferase
LPERTDGRRKQKRFLKALQDAPHQALHAAVYIWAAGQIQAGRVLDVGSEYGFGIALLRNSNPKLSVIGLESDISALRFARSEILSGGVALVNGEAQGLPFAAGSFTGACLVNLLHLVTAPQFVLGEVYRILKDEGTAILTTPRGEALRAICGEAVQVEQLAAQAGEVFSKVVIPRRIVGQLPGRSLQIFELNAQAPLFVMVCRKSHRNK